MKRSKFVEEAIVAHWGKRCPDYDSNCTICKAWGAYDRLRGIK